MTDFPAGRELLLRLIEQYSRGEVGVGDFCRDFEQVYNFETENKDLSEIETRTFRELFDKVVWYSPIAEERRTIPGYLGEEDKAAVSRAISVLKET